MKLVVIGAGGHSRCAHGTCLKAYVEANPGVVVLGAVCDLDEEKARAYARDFGFAATYTDVDEMIRKEKPDGILAITPLNVTLPLGKRLLTYGIPLLIEKPPGLNSAETLELRAVAQKHATRHMVSFNRRFDPALTRAQAWLEENHVDPLVALGRIVRPIRKEPDFVTGTSIHLLDTLLAVMGRAKSVSSVRTSAGGDAPAFFTSCITFDTNRTATAVICPDSGKHAETIEFFSNEIHLHLDMADSKVEIHRARNLELSWARDTEVARGLGDSSYYENAAFIDSILGKRRWGPTLADGLQTMQVAQIIARGGSEAL